jgi:glycosyltransferase involved in cell wall biosynthesis
MQNQVIYLFAPWSGDLHDGRKLRHYHTAAALESAYDIRTVLFVEGSGLWPRTRVLTGLASTIVYLPALPVERWTHHLKIAARVVNMGLFFCTALIWAIAISFRHRPTWIWGSAPPPAAGLVAAILAAAYRIPFIYEIRDPWPKLLVDLKLLAQASLTTRILRGLDLWLQKRASQIIVINADPETVRPDCKAKQLLLTNGLTPSVIQQAQPLVEARLRRPFAHSGKVRFICAGSFGTAYATECIIDAFQILLAHQPPNTFELLLYTDAPECESLQARIVSANLQTHVHVNRRIPFPQLLKILSEADYYILHLSSVDIFKWGINSNKLLDAFLVGLPIILASDVPDTPVTQSGAGFTCQPGDPQALAATLRAAIAVRPEDYAAMVRRSLRYRDEHLLLTRKIDQLAQRLKSTAPAQ